jgi:hypothetical protein
MSMHDTERSTSPNGYTSNSHDDSTPDSGSPKSSKETGRAMLAGLLGGVASAVGYIIYSRLEPEQKEKLHGTVRNVVESRISEIRSNFDI